MTHPDNPGAFGSALLALLYLFLLFFRGDRGVSGKPWEAKRRRTKQGI